MGKQIEAGLARSLAICAVALSAAGITLARSERSLARGLKHNDDGHRDPGAQHPAPQQNGKAGDDARPGTSVTISGPNLRGHIALSQSAVEVGDTRHVFAEVELQAVPDDDRHDRQPVAIAVVLDKSGSMEGEKISQARRAVLDLVRSMRSQDRIAVVTYSDSAHEISGMNEVGETLNRLEEIVPRIGADGGTNIGAGLAMGARELARAPSRFAKRILLLSDGQDTYGNNPQRIARAAVSEVDGVTISTLGIGHDFDERFMSTVAEVGQGNFAFLANTSRMHEFMAHELRSTSGTLVDEARVELNLPHGWRASRIYGADSSDRTGQITLAIGSVSTDCERRISVDLEVDAREIGSLGSMSAFVSYRTVANDNSHRIGVEGLSLVAVRTDEDALATRDINVYARTRAMEIASRQTEAVQAWQQGRGEDAARMSRENSVALDRLAAEAPAAAPSPALRNMAHSGATSFGTVAPSSTAGRGIGLTQGAGAAAAARGRAMEDAVY